MNDLEKFHPLGARIFIRPDTPAEMVGSLFIPNSARSPTNTGVVMAFGPGMLCKDGSRWPMPDIKRGQRVIYDARNPFHEVEIEGIRCVSVRDDDVFAVVEPE